MKTCSKCGIEKGLFLFGSDKKTIDGLNNWCKDCCNEYRRMSYIKHRESEVCKAKAYREANPETILQTGMRSYTKNRAVLLLRMKAYQIKNKEDIRLKRENNRSRLSEYSAKRYIENKEHILEVSKKWKRSNPDKVTAMTAKRRAMKLNATPTWLTKEHLKEIAEMYRRAKQLTKQTGEVYEVDHIFPLVSKISCGLHVPWNMQVIPANINRFKNNKIVSMNQIVEQLKIRDAIV